MKPNSFPHSRAAAWESILVALNIEGLGIHAKRNAEHWNDWYFNLEATPEVRVEVGGQAFTARVTITEGKERDQIYERFKSSGDHFAKYEQITQRIIPVIRLTPDKK